MRITATEAETMASQDPGAAGGEGKGAKGREEGRGREQGRERGRGDEGKAPQDLQRRRHVRLVRPDLDDEEMQRLPRRPLL